jgi:trimethylamine:corrinoid methyltransferase-like protein
MQPILELLEPELVQRILEEALQLLQEPGVKVQSPPGLALLEAAGARVDPTRQVVCMPEAMVRGALETVPHEFTLYARDGEPAVRYGGTAVHFDPGSSGVNVLDADTGEHRPAVTADLVRLIRVTEVLPAFDAQSTAVVCSDVPQAIGDLYRLYLVLLYSGKPIVTGAFSTTTLPAMVDMLAVYRGGREALAERPLAVFDVCPTPPLIWSQFAAQNLIDLARARVPAQMVSMPLAGVGAPVTLLGSIVQHAAESLSGIVLHQLAQPGAPIVWGGAPAIFDMRSGTTPMGAIETAMIDVAYAQVGRSLGLPTHTYLGASDAKLIDAQAGMESGITAVLGALGGINMISGAGMLDFLACQSAEKLVVDAEAIGMAKRLAAGIEARTATLAIEMFAGIDFKPDFLKQKLTRQLFAREQLLPSVVIDRGTARAWLEAGRPDTMVRARARTQEILRGYERPRGSIEQETELRELVARLARAAGMDALPELEAD